MQILSDSAFNNQGQYTFKSRRIERTMQYLNENFDKPVSLNEVAKLVNMSNVSFSRFFKLRNGNTFIESLNEIRLGHASRMLIDTTDSIAEIAYNCGFNNISNFNRIFRKKKGCTPKEFRQSYNYESRVFI